MPEQGGEGEQGKTGVGMQLADAETMATLAPAEPAEPVGGLVEPLLALHQGPEGGQLALEGGEIALDQRFEGQIARLGPGLAERGALLADQMTIDFHRPSRARRLYTDSPFC